MGNFHNMVISRSHNLIHIITVFGALPIPLLGNSPPSNITFTNACMTAHMALASSPRYTKQTTSATHKLHKKYKLLVAHLHHQKSVPVRQGNPHPLIQREPLWDKEALTTRIAQLKDTISKKARKRETLRMALFRKTRSALYASKLRQLPVGKKTKQNSQ
jgi:hypothetical protein